MTTTKITIPAKFHYLEKFTKKTLEESTGWTEGMNLGDGFIITATDDMILHVGFLQGSLPGNEMDKIATACASFMDACLEFEKCDRIGSYLKRFLAPVYQAYVNILERLN